jgi:hypothetical protein
MNYIYQGEHFLKILLSPGTVNCNTAIVHRDLGLSHRGAFIVFQSEMNNNKRPNIQVKGIGRVPVLYVGSSVFSARDW